MSNPKGKRRHFVSLPSQDNIAVVEDPCASDSPSTSRNDVHHGSSVDIAPSKPRCTSLYINSADERTRLHRGLSARQVQMIAIAGKRTPSVPAIVYSDGLISCGPTGTIGTGLFLGTSKSLAQGGPASMLIAYSIVGFIVYVTLLLLGEMATQYPVAGMYNCRSSLARRTDGEHYWSRFIQRICP